VGGGEGVEVVMQVKNSHLKERSLTLLKAYYLQLKTLYLSIQEESVGLILCICEKMLEMEEK